MTDPGWYPPGQVCYPPELPPYLSNVYDLKPIVGAPNDSEVIGIHAVLHAARKASEIPGMHNPDLIMKLGDHLFGVQMARYRSKHSLITFPSDATYTPPALPTHVATNLEPICGAPSDEEILKVQDTIQIYQEFRRVPSMFDAHVHMGLSQHLFDIQMARYMRRAGESLSSPVPQAAPRRDNPVRTAQTTFDDTGEATTPTNNPGTGASADIAHGTSHLIPGIDVRELIAQSNRITERCNQLLEVSNELMGRQTNASDLSNSHTLGERFNQVLERLIQLAEHSCQPARSSDQSAERFNELFERLDQLAEQTNQSTQGIVRLAERLDQSSKRSNQLAEQANKSWKRLGDVLGNINGVLVRIQHAIVRNRKGNDIGALDCLVNEQGETPAASDITATVNFVWMSKNNGNKPQDQISVKIDGSNQAVYISDDMLGRFLRFYGIGTDVRTDAQSTLLKEGMQYTARERLREYLSSCLG